MSGRGDLERLDRRIAAYEARRAIVAFSGGVDSAVVLAAAVRALGLEEVQAVTAVSASYPTGELEAARATAGALGVTLRTVATAEVEDPSYARNDALRCFHCKTELYSVLGRIREAARLAAEAGPVILAGANADDRADFRPGLRAAASFGVRNPLLEEGLGKDAVRAVARTLGVPVADKPAMACLSSRVAFGMPITPALLRRIDAAERLVRSLGFDQVRVRHRGDRATVEVPPADVARLRGHPKLGLVLADLRAMGWTAAEVDDLGYRPGAMNATLVRLRRPAVSLRATGRG